VRVGYERGIADLGTNCVVGKCSALREVSRKLERLESSQVPYRGSNQGRISQQVRSRAVVSEDAVGSTQVG